MKVIIICLIAFLASTNCMDPINKCSLQNTLADFTKLVHTVYQDRSNSTHLINDATKIISGWTSEQLDCVRDWFFEYKLPTSELTNIGFLLLGTSNCLKDVGPVFILIDNIITYVKDKDYQNALVNTIFTGLLAKQSYTDCSPLFRSIIDSMMK